MKWFKNFKIGTKLISTFLIIAVIAGGIGVFGVLNINSINNNGTALYEDNTVDIYNTGSAAVFYQRIRFYALDMATNTDESARNTAINGLTQYMSQVDNYLAEIASKVMTEDESKIFATVRDNWTIYKGYVNKAIEHTRSGRMKDAHDLILTEARAVGITVQDSFVKLLNCNFSLAKQKTLINNEDALLSTYIMIGLSAAGVIAALLLGIFVARTVSKPVKSMVAAAEKLAAGETAVMLNINTKDEIGKLARSFGSVVGAVQSLIADTSMLTEAAKEGRLSTRADASRHQGDYRIIVEGINSTLDAVTGPINEEAKVLESVSNGILSESVTGDYKGDHAIIKEALNETVSSVRGYVEEVASVLKEIAQGNLCVKIESEYKGDFVSLKDSINEIISSLNSMLFEINTAADQVASGTKQVSDGSNEISQGATVQASSIEELSVSLTQIAEQIKQNAANTQKAKDLSETAQSESYKGNEQMKALQQAMDELNESSVSISKIIKVIDDIAFQTNILALNAAVEAARAGIHGKGFAVVAEEVRNLAARSAGAAKETADLIEGSIKKVGLGTKLADVTGISLKAIMSGAAETAKLTGHIATATSEQASGIAQINSGIEHLSQVVQTNSATAEEAAAASEQLSGQAELLKQMVAKFKLTSDESIEQAGSVSNDISVYHENYARPSIALNDDEFGKY